MIPGKRTYIVLFTLVVVVGLLAAVLGVRLLSGRGSISPTPKEATFTVAALNAPAQVKAKADYVSDNVNDEEEIQAAINVLPGTGDKKVVLVGDFTKGSAAGINVPSNTTIELTGSITLAKNINTDASIFANSNKTEGNRNITITGGKLDGNALNQTGGKQYAIDFENVKGGKVVAYIEAFRSGDSRTKASDVEIRNLNYEREPLVLNSCDSPSGWNLNNTTIDTSIYKSGTGSLRMAPVKNNDAVASLNLSPTLDARFFNLEFWAYASNWAGIDEIKWYFWYQGSPTPYELDIKNLNLYMTAGQWYKVTIPTSDWSFPSLEDWRNLSDLRIRVVGNAGYYFYLDQIRLVPKYSRPLFSIIFDDGYVGTYTIAPPILAKYGYTATVALSLAHETRSTYLDSIYNKYNWDLASHTVTHPHLPSLDDANLTYELSASRKWLIDHGYPRGADFFVFPYHDYNPAAISKARLFYSGWRTPSVAVPMDVYFGLPNTVGGTAGRPQDLALIDRAYLYHDWVILSGHNVGAREDTTPTGLETTASYLYNLGAVVKKPSEVIASQKKTK